MTDRELDAAVAERVMGWRNVRCNEGGNVPYGEPDDDYNEDYPDNPHREPVNEYTTDMRAAWRVVERMRERGWYFGLQTHSDPWYAQFHEPKPEGAFVEVHAATAPRAICEAALAALEGAA